MKTLTQIQAQKAKDQGYKYIASVVKSVYNTTYYHVNSVDDVISRGWIAAPCGQYPSAKDSNSSWTGRCGQSFLPEKTILKTALYSI